MEDRLDDVRVEDIPSFKVLGTYEGECADATITNKNGLDITRPVWENVFASDDYKQAIDLGWYIGFLGHPDDPNCMDFRNACIVMREGRIEESGKIYGKFDLIDTPVGRVVKAFQDAGVTFGISVRGAGDIISNSVDPDTFVFRGFDLVTFPAYPDAIPTFTSIAASTDSEKQATYKKVCQAVRDNLQEISSAASIDVIKSQFANQSEEYSELEARKEEITSECKEDSVEGSEDIEDNSEEIDLEAKCNVLQEKLEAMQQLYKKSVVASRNYQKKISEYQRKQKRVSSIMMSQFRDLKKNSEESSEELKKSEIRCSELRKQNQVLRNKNLKYKQEIASSQSILEEKDSVLASVRRQLSETVKKMKTEQENASNLDDEIRSIRQELTASTKLLKSYQKSYIDLYAMAVGVDASKVDITASTSVEAAQSAIMRCSRQVIKEDPVVVTDVEFDDDSLVTI